MNFEDRLRGHLQQQNDDISVEPEAPSAIAGRSAARSRRRAIGLPAAVIMLAGLAGGGYWASQGNTSDSVEIVADDDIDEASETPADEDTAQDGAELQEAGPDDDADDGAERFGAGASLTFENIATENSPSAWTPGHTTEDRGIYYVLSTAPGQSATYESFDEDAFRPNTFYVYDGEWQVNEVSDYLISDFDAADGIIYAVSTGTTSTTAISLGTSRDQGASWNWEQLPSGDFTDDEIASLTLMVAAEDDRQIVVGSRSRSHFETAYELASSAGFEVDQWSITKVTDEGFAYYDHQANEDARYEALDRCDRLEADYWSGINANVEPATEAEWTEEAEEAAYERYRVEINGLYSALEADGCGEEVKCRKVSQMFYDDPANAISPEIEPPPPDASDAELEEFDAAFEARMEEMDRFYEDQQDQLDQQLIDAGCGVEVTCRNLIEALYEGPAFTPPFEEPEFEGPYEDLSDEELLELDRVWQQHSEEVDRWYEKSAEPRTLATLETITAMEAEGCDKDRYPYLDEDMVAMADALGIDVPEQAPPLEYEPELTNVSWAELGITNPDIESRVLVNLVSAEPTLTTRANVSNHVLDVSAADGEFVIVTMENGDLYDEAAVPGYSEWASVDGQNWAEKPVLRFDFLDGADRPVNGQRFSLDWTERGGQLLRSSDNWTTSEVVDVAELVPDLGIVEPVDVGVGPLGVLVTVERRPSGDITYLFSADGTSWSTSDVDGLAGHAIIGDDSLLILGAPEITVPGSDEDAITPVLLGRVGG